MARMWDLDDLASVGDLGLIFHVGRSTVANWVVRYPDFPAEIVKVGATNIYSISQVRAWRKGRF